MKGKAKVPVQDA